MFRYLRPTIINTNINPGRSNRLFSNYLSKSDIHNIEIQKAKIKTTYLNRLNNIPNYDKYIKLFGDENKFCDRGIIAKFCHTDWCKLERDIPKWSYPQIYVQAKTVFERSSNSWEDLVAQEYAYETMQTIENHFKKQNLKVDDFI